MISKYLSDVPSLQFPNLHVAEGTVLVALIDKLGGDVRITMKDIATLPAGSKIIYYTDPETQDIVFRLLKP